MWAAVKIGAIIGAVGIMFLFLGLVVMVTRPALLTGVDGSSLAYSVSGGMSGSSDGGVCTKGEDGDWTCSVHGPSANGTYAVDVDWTGCWDASLTADRSKFAGPQSLSGCIKLGDVITIESFND